MFAFASASKVVSETLQRDSLTSAAICSQCQALKLSVVFPTSSACTCSKEHDLCNPPSVSRRNHAGVNDCHEGRASASMKVKVQDSQQQRREARAHLKLAWRGFQSLETVVWLDADISAQD